MAQFDRQPRQDANELREEEEFLDESLEETFPASDPIAPADPELDERQPG